MILLLLRRLIPRLQLSVAWRNTNGPVCRAKGTTEAATALSSSSSGCTQRGGELRRLAKGEHLRMLEVGALSTENACSATGLFKMVHIDLNSQRPGILQQDFMQRPIPTTDEERFDIISLSLVLNYVPDPALRGQMLVRTLQFLRQPEVPVTQTARGVLPSLFLVLPRSCVTNSRYFSVERLTELMTLLGYSLENSKCTNKLAYFLWVSNQPCQTPLMPFPKREVNPGHDRNNFVVVLKPS